jgi:hypothetical protein
MSDGVLPQQLPDVPQLAVVHGHSSSFWQGSTGFCRAVTDHFGSLVHGQVTGLGPHQPQTVSQSHRVGRAS